MDRAHESALVSAVRTIAEELPAIRDRVEDAANYIGGILAVVQQEPLVENTALMRKMSPAARKYVARQVAWHRWDMPPKQAVAVALSEARRHGYWVPDRNPVYHLVLTFPLWSDREGFARVIQEMHPAVSARVSGTRVILTSDSAEALRLAAADVRFDMPYVRRGRLRAHSRRNPLTPSETLDVLSRASQHRRRVRSLSPTSAMHAYGSGRADSYEHVATLYGVGTNPPRNPYPFPARYLDNGFWSISGVIAGRLARAAGSRLPRPGYMLRITVLGVPHWLMRTPVGGRVVWSIRADAPGGVGPNPLTRAETAAVLRSYRAADAIRRLHSRYVKAEAAPVTRAGQMREHHLREAEHWGGRAYEAARLADRFGTARRQYGLPRSALRSNPGRGVRIVGRIPGTMHTILYRRTGRYAGSYYHRFGRGVTAHRLSDGSVLLRGPRPLWVRT